MRNTKMELGCTLRSVQTTASGNGFREKSAILAFSVRGGSRMKRQLGIPTPRAPAWLDFSPLRVSSNCGSSGKESASARLAPAGSIGNFAFTLPSVFLNSSTLRRRKPRRNGRFDRCQRGSFRAEREKKALVQKIALNSGVIDDASACRRHAKESPLKRENVKIMKHANLR